MAQDWTEIRWVNGSVLDGTQHSFISNNSQGNGSNGLTVSAGISDWSVIGCEANNSILGNAQGYGVFVAAGASDRYVVQGNNLTGNAVGAVSDGGTGANKKVSGNIGYDPPILAPSLVNSWANFGGAYATAGYWKDAEGVVHLSGLLKDGAVGSAMFTLPAGYRPAAREVFAVFSNGALGLCDIDTNGQVITVSGSNLSFSISGVAFKAA